MSASTSHDLHDYVTVDLSVNRPGVFQITKVPTKRREVNYVAEPVGGGRGVRGPGYLFTPATAAERDAALAQAAAAPPRVPLSKGHLVQVSDIPGLDATGYYVVLGRAPRARDAAKLVKLGGDGDRYYSPIPERLCTIIEPRSVLLPPPTGDATLPRAATAPTASSPTMGQLVVVSGVPRIRPTDYYVVLGSAANSLDGVQLVKLGSEGGRYWPNLPERLCTVIDLTAVLAGGAPTDDDSGRVRSP